MTFVETLLAPRRSWAAAAIAHMTLIAWSSHRTWERTVPRLPGLGNLVHVPLYFALGFMAAAALGVRAEGGVRRAVFAVTWAGLFGIADEIHQGFVPGRSPSALDVVVDVLAASAAALVVRLVTGDAAARRPRAILAAGLVAAGAAVAAIPDLVA